MENFILNIPIEPEDGNNRLNKSKVFKKRNKAFGTYKDAVQSYPNNDAILRKIFEARYSKTQQGCPCCGMPYHLFKKVKDKPAFRCKCSYKVYPLKGTHLEQSRTQLTEFLELIYNMFCSKNGIPATFLERKYGGDYDTWLYNLHKVDDWMGWSNETQHFTPGSTIEIDEVYPKAQTGLGPYYKFKKGSGSERTNGVVVMTERDDPQSGFHGITKAFVFDKNSRSDVEKIIRKYIKAENKHNLYTDESDYYNFLNHSGYNRSTVKHKQKEYKNGDCTTNMVEGYNERIKTLIHSIYLGVHPDYLQLYVNRITFNHCNRSKTFFQALEVLFSSLPGFHESVKRNFTSKRKAKNARNNNYKNAA